MNYGVNHDFYYVLQGVMSGILPNQHFPDLMGNPSSAVIGATVALCEIGCMFGGLLTGRLGDMIGRKNTIRLGSFILIIGAVLQTATQGLAMTIVARISIGSLSIKISWSSCLF